MKCFFVKRKWNQSDDKRKSRRSRKKNLNELLENGLFSTDEKCKRFVLVELQNFSDNSRFLSHKTRFSFLFSDPFSLWFFYAFTFSRLILNHGRDKNDSFFFQMKSWMTPTLVKRSKGDFPCFFANVKTYSIILVRFWLNEMDKNVRTKRVDHGEVNMAKFNQEKKKWRETTKYSSIFKLKPSTFFIYSLFCGFASIGQTNTVKAVNAMNSNHLRCFLFDSNICAERKTLAKKNHSHLFNQIDCIEWNWRRSSTKWTPATERKEEKWRKKKVSSTQCTACAID